VSAFTKKLPCKAFANHPCRRPYFTQNTVVTECHQRL
jgi:hypothetical protein